MALFRFKSKEERERLKQKKQEEEYRRRQEKEEEEYKKRQEKYDDNIREVHQKHTYKNIIEKLSFNTFTKRLVAFVLFICLFDLQLTYILAFLGRDQIAESLSTTICNTILGVAAIYMIRAYFDTRAEKKEEHKKEEINITDKFKDELHQAVVSKVQSVMNDAGITVTPTYNNNDNSTTDDFVDDYLGGD